MSKILIHKLAKDLNVKSGDILGVLSMLGVEGKTASSSLEDDQVAKIKDIFRKQEEAQKSKKVEKKAAKVEKPAPLTLQSKAEAPRAEEKKRFPEKPAAPRLEAKAEAPAVEAPRAPVFGRGSIGIGTIISKAKPASVPEKPPAPPEEPPAPPVLEQVPVPVAEKPAAPVTAPPTKMPLPPGTIIKVKVPIIPGSREPGAEHTIVRIPVMPGAKPPVPGMVKVPVPVAKAPAPPAVPPPAKPSTPPVAQPPVPAAKVPAPVSAVAPKPPAAPPAKAAPPIGVRAAPGHVSQPPRGPSRYSQGPQGRPHAHPGSRQHPPKHHPVPAPSKEAAVPKPGGKVVELPMFLTVAELAGKMHIPPRDIITHLMKQGEMTTMNQTLTYEKAGQIADAFGYLFEEAKEVVETAEVAPRAEEKLYPRPPVVTVLGHVDHGKTSLLDAIRKTNVTAEEAGGITQRIGASTIDFEGRKIVFLDTPGHEAFTAMRARGAQVTDIAILVVAADDGVMPQTVEAINHAKAAKVPIIVVINKVDKPQANPERVKQQLSDLDLLPEDWGGETICISVSAKQKIGLDDVLEMICLVADMQELKANPYRSAQGIIIEARLDKGLGPVATVLVQNGTLRVGDAVIAGAADGKVRAMISDKSDRLREATPSIPVEIIGLTSVPQAGDTLQVVEDEKMARIIADSRKQKTRDEKMHVVQRTTLDDLFKQMEVGEVKDLNIIIKADSQGTVEALRHALSRLTTPEVRINVIHGGVGTVTESDILLATASNAIIIGFNIRPDPSVKKLAEQENVDIRLYRVIYHVIEDVKAALLGMLEPEYEEVLIGRAEVRATFKITKVGVIAGCYVTDGKITRDADVRLLRDSVVVYEGKLNSLKRFKEDVKEVLAGYECGLGIEKYGGILEGDVIEVYKQQVKTKELAGEAS